MNQPRLLVVEDDSCMADLICLLAQEAQFNASICEGAHFTAIYQQWKPDVILLDILMPGMDGFEILRYLHQQQSRARVVLLSVSERYRQTAELMGLELNLLIAANIAKPFHASDLQRLLGEIRASLPAEYPVQAASAEG